MIIPIVDWIVENDGYGIIGYSWMCSICGQMHRFVVPYAPHDYFCGKCGEQHLSNFEED